MNTENSTSLSSISKLSYEVRERLFDSVASILEKAGGSLTAKVFRIEKSLTRYLAKRWKETANKAVTAALSVLDGDQEAIVSKADAQKIIQTLEDGFAGFGKAMTKRLEKDFKSFYRANKTDFVQRFDLKPNGTKKELTFDGRTVRSVTIEKADIDLTASFSVIDREAMDMLTKITAISIGDHFVKDLKPAVVKAVMEGVFELKLNKKNAGEYLKKELTRIVGATNLAVPPSVAQLGEDKVNDYFKGLSTTNLNFARNFGQVTAMEEAGIAQYRIVAIVDNRTTVICLQLNGQTFELRYALEHRDKMLKMESVEELKNYAPWHRDISEVGLSADRNKETPTAQEVLAKAGMSLPPYHWLCRTEVHPV